MSKSAFVEFRGHGFWAYSVAVGILFKHVIDHAVPLASGNGWLDHLIQKWRFNAVVADCGLYLDDSWSPDQLKTVDGLLEDACVTLQQQDRFAAEEMYGWDILDGQGVFDRGHDGYDSAPVVLLGEAIRKLLEGTLEPAPEGTWWFYGVLEGRSTVKMRTS